MLLHWRVKDEGDKKRACPSSGISCAGHNAHISSAWKNSWCSRDSNTAKGKARCAHRVAHSQGILRALAMVSSHSAHTCTLKTHPSFFWDVLPDSAGFLDPIGHRQSAQKVNKSKAKPQRSGDCLENSPCPPQAGGDAVGGDARCLTGCSTSSGSAGVPVRSELQNSEMLIRQQSLASEPFPWGSYSGAIYSWNCKS